MPIGDPHGGLFDYTDEGLPECIHACRIPVTDVQRSLRFYVDALGMELLHSDGCRAYLRRMECRVMLEKSDVAGIDTGLFFGTGNPYDTHRRLVDEGVVFVQEPVHGPFGTYTSFLDCDSNIIHMIERNGGFRLRSSQEEVLHRV